MDGKFRGVVSHGVHFLGDAGLIAGGAVADRSVYRFAVSENAHNSLIVRLYPDLIARNTDQPLDQDVFHGLAVFKLGGLVRFLWRTEDDDIARRRLADSICELV